MAEEAAALARKIAAARSRGDEGGLDPGRAFDLAFARVAERTMGLALRLAAAEASRATPAEVAELVPDGALFLLLDGPKGALGLAALSPEALAALTGMLTLGRAADPPAQPRRPTRTDAALVGDFLDPVLAEAETLLAAEEAATWLTGFRAGAHLADPRALALILEEPAYRLWRLALTFAAGEETRPGTLLLALPEAGRGPAPRRDAPAAAAPDLGASDAPASGLTVGDGARGGDWAAALERAVLPATAEVDAILARVTLPLADLLRLDRGMILTLGAAALDAVRLEGEDGSVIALARLGQGGGRRAARIGPRSADDSDLAAAPLPLAATPAQLILPFEMPVDPARDWAADAAAELTVTPEGRDPPAPDAPDSRKLFA